MKNDEISLRDLFAGQAMAAYIAAPRGKYTVPSLEVRSVFAYKQADAMLAERERSKGATINRRTQNERT